MADRRTVILRAYQAAALVTQTLPAPLVDAAASAAALGLAQVQADRRAMVGRHLQRAYGRPLSGVELRRAVDRAFDSYARYYTDSFRIPRLSAAEIDAGFEWAGFGHLLDALEAGTGALLPIPHLGGWEWAGRWVADLGYPITVVVEPIEPPELFEWFVGYRRSLGMRVVPLGPKAGAEVLAAVRRNEIVCLLCDRDLKGGGVPVTFFGEQTTLPGGPATLALRSGAPLIPVGVYFTARRNGHRAVVGPPIAFERSGRLRDDVGRLTQLIAGRLEALIKVAPDQWHLFQPNWPSDPGYGL